jgi:hypothetical protein
MRGEPLRRKEERVETWQGRPALSGEEEVSGQIPMLKFYNRALAAVESGSWIATEPRHRFRPSKGSYFSQGTVDLIPCPGSNTATAFTDARKDMKNG